MRFRVRSAIFDCDDNGSLWRHWRGLFSPTAFLLPSFFYHVVCSVFFILFSFFLFVILGFSCCLLSLSYRSLSFVITFAPMKIFVSILPNRRLQLFFVFILPRFTFSTLHFDLFNQYFAIRNFMQRHLSLKIRVFHARCYCMCKNSVPCWWKRAKGTQPGFVYVSVCFFFSVYLVLSLFLFVCLLGCLCLCVSFFSVCTAVCVRLSVSSFSLGTSRQSELIHDRKNNSHYTLFCSDGVQFPAKM